MGWGISFLVYLKVIHFTCLIFVSNNCFKDHRIIKSVANRLISIFCTLATSCIKCSVSIASQIKGIVLSNNFKNQKEVLERVFYKILPILLLKWSNRATGDMPN